MPTRTLYLVFALSGISGLIYQVVWVRWFGRLFGNTMYSAALVVSVFMCGLGFGSYVVGRWIDRRFSERPDLAVRGYAYSELAIAGLGALIALTLPSLEPLAASISSYTTTDAGWYELSAMSWVFRSAIAIAVLAPITFLMGGTLTLLIRHLLATDLSLSGWRVGALYGFNTAGAAFGAFASDFALIPALGLFATQMLAVLFNLVAGLVALRLLRRPVGTEPDTEPDPAPEPESGQPTAPVISRQVVFTALAIALSGFFAMGAEIIWFRQFQITLGSYRAVFSLLLTVILVGIWLGSLAGGYCHRKLGRPALLFMVAQSALVATTLLLLSLDLGDRGGSGSITVDLLGPMVLVVGVPALLMGVSFPLANANVQRTRERVGQRAGFLYLANTLGGVAGSACAGFLLVPALGTRGSVSALACFGILSVVALALSRTRADVPRRHVVGVYAACGALVAIGVIRWWAMPGDRYERIGFFNQETVVTVSEGVNELVGVAECDCYDGRRLRTNGHNMSGTGRLAQRYMRAFSHVPLLHLDDPQAALVICFGVGTTLHAASLHPVDRLEVVDLSRNVLSHARYFEASNRGVLDDPRTRVFVNDGRAHLWMQEPGTYDLITLEPPPPTFAGVSSLYSREFYELARSRLRDGGLMSQWLPSYQIPEESVRAVVRAFLDVFPNAILISGERNELVLIGANAETLTIDPEQLQRLLDSRPAVQKDLAQVYMGTVTEILGSFVAGPETLRAATRGVAPVTDDHPSLEYEVGSPGKCYTTQFPRDMIGLGEITTWCPQCFSNEQPHPAAGPLADYLTVTAAYYHSDMFATFSTCDGGRHAAINLQIPPTAPVFSQTEYLRQLLSPMPTGTP